MSNGKALFPLLVRDAFSRLLSLVSGDPAAKARRPIKGRATDIPRFRAVEGISQLLHETDNPPCTFMAIAEVHRFNLLRRQIGHKLANQLIARLAERLGQGGPGVKLGRIGRNTIEFAFAAPSISDAEAQLKAIVATLENEIDLDGYRFQLPIFIGATEIGGQPVDEELVDRAAAAVTEAQEMHRKVRVTGLNLDTTDNTVSQLDMMRDLRLAIACDALELHYQPKLRARTNKIDSAEALLRWVHPEHGAVPTDKLVAMAEASGAIHDLTRWVIERAISDQGRLVEQGIEISISINLSGALVADTEFCRWATKRLTAAKGKFGFEITETAVIDDPETALANLRLFSQAGIMIAIDDYGSGLSSLAYLKQLPANELKIDRMFISGLTDSHRDPLLVRSSIDLAHALEMEVTAEGVTDPMTLSLLRIMGCDRMQGYLISHPLPLETLQTFLAENLQANADWELPAALAEWGIDGTATPTEKQLG